MGSHRYIHQIDPQTTASKVSVDSTKQAGRVRPWWSDAERPRPDARSDPAGHTLSRVRVHGGGPAAVPRELVPAPIPALVRAKMEAVLGADFSDVRVYPESARAEEMKALAFTQGDRIHVAPGQWAPETPSGQRLLGHELGHVLQQRAGRVVSLPQLKGGGANRDPALEAEADAMGAQAAGPDAATLESELERDYWTIHHELDKLIYTDAVEERVIAILRRWAQTRPAGGGKDVGRSEHLDRLFARLRKATKNVGTLADQVTSYYDLIFDEFDRADEVRQIRDRHSKLFIGEEPVSKAKLLGTGKDDFFGDLWEDVKSGAIAERLGWYFVGMVEAGKGMVEGMAMLLTPDGWLKMIKGIGELPATLSILWKNKEKFWNAFISAPPNEQAHMIGRVVGEIEIQLLALGAGGGAGAGNAPALARAVEVVPGRAAAALKMGGVLPIDLAMLGGESGRFVALMSKTAEATTKAKKAANELEYESTSKSPGPSEPVTAPERPAAAPAQPAAKAVEVKPISQKVWRNLSKAEQRAYIDAWIEKNGVTRVTAPRDHHAWPMYLGGPENGPLITIEEELHVALHSRLDKYLPRRKTMEFYAKLPQAEKAKNIQILREVIQDFDRDFGTQIAPVLEEALKGSFRAAP